MLDDALEQEEVLEPEVTADAEAEGEEMPQEPQGEQEEAPPDPSPEKKEGSQGVQKRIDELTRQKHDTERERDYWRQQAEAKPPEPVKAEKVKTLKDFEYDEGQYQAYMFQETTNRAVTAARGEFQADQARQTQLGRQSAYAAKEAEYSKDHADFIEMSRSPSLPFTADMYSIVTEMDEGPAVLHHLAKNHDVADRIARLPPNIQAMELGRIGERLSRTEKGPSVSKAPDPAPKLKSGQPGIKKDPAEMSQSDFEKWRRKTIENR